MGACSWPGPRPGWRAPVLVKLHPGVPDRPRRGAGQAYSFTMYLMAGLLILGFLANHLVSEVEHRFHDLVTA